MRLTLSLAFASLVAAFATGSVDAQSFFFGGSGYHHASTVEEGAARGMADVIRSRGAANMMNSRAAINYEEARKRYIQNRLHATNTYFEMRAVNKKARFSSMDQPNQQDLIRYSSAKLPDRLDATQLDPLSGTLRWPLILKLKEFDAGRAELDAIFLRRAKEGFLTPEQYLTVQNQTKAMTDELRNHARKFPGSQTIEARKFLESLAYETRFPTS